MGIRKKINAIWWNIH